LLMADRNHNCSIVCLRLNVIDHCHRKIIAFTGNYRVHNTDKVYGGVLLTGKFRRTWDITHMPPDEIRQDIGIGHMLHFAAMVTDNQSITGLVCPVMVQLRKSTDLRVQLEDMPVEYHTRTQFAIAIVQARDSRKFLPLPFDSDSLVCRNSRLEHQACDTIVQRSVVCAHTRREAHTGQGNCCSTSRVHPREWLRNHSLLHQV
jgi:hypothetical protein